MAAKADKTEMMPLQYRTYPIDAERGVDKDSRTISLAFASETPVDQVYGRRRVREILEVSDKAMDLSRMRGAPLLVNHDHALLVGSVMAARVDGDRMGRANVKFGNSTRAKEEFQDVLDGIRTNVSFGYRVNEVDELGIVDGVETVRVTSYTPFEISLVSVPADPRVGISRSATNNETFPVIMRTLLNQTAAEGGGGTTATVTSPAPAPAAPAKPLGTAERDQLRRQARQDEQTRIREINAIAEKINHPDVYTLAEEFTASERSLDQFRAAVLESEVYKAVPVSAADSGLLGMSDSDIQEYSLTRAILRIAEGRPLDGIEREASMAVAKKVRRNPNGFFVPADVAIRGFGDSKRLSASQRQQVSDQVRALQTNVFSAAGALVGTDLMGGSLIELLRNAMFVMQMGARSLTGLVGDVAIPRQTGGATAYWLGQGAALTRTQQVVDQLALTPHRLAAATAYDKQLLAQSSVSVEAFVREDLTAILALEKDRVAINGSGVAGEPLGILQTTGLSTPVTFATAAAPLFTEAIKFETNLASNNADRGRLGYLMTPTARGHLKGYPKFASTGTPIWENDIVNGYPAKATNQVPAANPVIFGRWDDLIIADWDGLDVVVDPFSLSLNGQISVVIQTLTDVGIRHAKSFVKGINP